MHPIVSGAITTVLVLFALWRRALTWDGIFALILTAAAHAVHPWNGFYALPVIFFLTGTAVSKVKHAYKSTLTVSSAGGSLPPSAPHPRNAVQVLANSLPASIFIVLHYFHLRTRLDKAPGFLIGKSTIFPQVCLPYPTFPAAGSGTVPPLLDGLANVLPYGIVATYAAAAADTFASELGILSRSQPVLITALLRNKIRRVPRGTNGGITPEGVLASIVGAAIVSFAAAYALPLCGSSEDIVEKRAAFVHQYHLSQGVQAARRWSDNDRLAFALAMTAAGTIGALWDSVLGACVQASVVDARTGKVVEGDGGAKVLYAKAAAPTKKTDDPSARTLLVGRNWLSNNGVNLAMTTSAAVGAAAVALALNGGPFPEA